MPLVLFDVDMTLVACGPVGHEVFEAAVRDVIGIDPTGHGVRMGGKTDPQIIAEVLAAVGLTDGAADQHRKAILARLAQGLATAMPRISAEGRVMPGVVETLSRLRREPSVVPSVLTGNIKPNARVKLAAFGLDTLVDLECGAYGSDSARRTDLVPVAIARTAATRGLTFTPEQTWVVGDTPLDLACARAVGARCLLVATGSHPYDELAGAGADALLPDLSEVDRVLELLLG